MSQNSFFLPSSSFIPRSIKKRARIENSRSYFQDKKLETRGAGSKRSAPRPKGFASSVRLSRAPPPLLQFACPLFNRLSAFSTVHHPSLHLPFVLVCIFFNLFARGFIRSPRSSSSRGSSLASILPCRFIRAADPNLSRPNFFSQGSNVFLGCSEILPPRRICFHRESSSRSSRWCLSLSYERGGSFERLKMDFERGLLASSSLFLSGKFLTNIFFEIFLS